MFQDPLLLLVGAPIIAGIVCLILPERLKMLARSGAFLVTAAALAGSIYVFIRKPLSFYAAGSQVFAADALSAFIAAVIAVFGLLLAIYSAGYVEHRVCRYFGYFLITLGSAVGAVFANNLILLMVFWGILAVTLYLLVNMQGTAASAQAAKKALIIVGGTDALMIFGITLLWAMAGTFSAGNIRVELNGLFPFMAYLAIASAALAKAGAMPFHSWLPEVAEAGPTPVTAYLPASLDKLLGIYLLARASLNLFVMNTVSNTILLAVGSATIVIAVMVALVQHDLKKLLGYHAVSQVGYMVLGIGTGNPVGIAGGLFHMLNHAVYKSCLFLSAGNVEKRSGTTDLGRLGGLARYMPVTFVAFLVASCSISGIPPFNGFVSKWMLYQGLIESATPKNHLWMLWLVCAMFGSSLTIASFMKLLHAVFLGRPDPGLRNIKEAPVSMSLPVAVLALICLVFGIFAFVIPIPLLIIPAIRMSIQYAGQWNPIIATVLIIAGIAVGAIIYALSRGGKGRTVGAFIGGEEAGTLNRLSGTEFYDTIRDEKGLRTFYRKEADGAWDPYNIVRSSVYFFTEIFKRLHNGVLPTYMVWSLLGMAAMFIVILFR